MRLLIDDIQDAILALQKVEQRLLERSAEVEAVDNPVLRQRLDDLPWSKRAGDVLLRLLGPNATFGDLIGLHPNEIMREFNVGRKSLAEIEEVLARYGLALTRGWKA